MLPSNPNPPNCNMACAKKLQKNIIRTWLSNTRYMWRIYLQNYKTICNLEKKPRCVGLHLQRRLNDSWGWRPASEDNIVTLCWGVCDSTIFKTGYRPGRSDWYPWVCMTNRALVQPDGSLHTTTELYSDPPAGEHKADRCEHGTERYYPYLWRTSRTAKP